MLNSPAFESQTCLPRTGLPCYGFIILQSFQPNSDTIWVIINRSQRSAPAQSSSACSSLACEGFKINSTASLFLLIVLFWKEKRKESNFQNLVEVFFSPFPQHPSGEGTSTLVVSLPQKWVVVSILCSKSECSGVSNIPAATGGGTAHAPHKALQMVVFNSSQGSSLLPRAVHTTCLQSLVSQMPSTAWHHNLTQISHDGEHPPA